MVEFQKELVQNSEYFEDLYDNKCRLLKYKNTEEFNLSFSDNIKEFYKENLDDLFILLSDMFNYDYKNRISAENCMNNNFF